MTWLKNVFAVVLQFDDSCYAYVVAKQCDLFSTRNSTINTSLHYQSECKILFNYAIHKQTCLRSETHWKLLLYLNFHSFFESTGPNCFNNPPLLRLFFSFVSLGNWSWFTDSKHFFTDDDLHISSSCIKHENALFVFNSKPVLTP